MLKNAFLLTEIPSQLDLYMPSILLYIYKRNSIIMCLTSYYRIVNIHGGFGFQFDKLEVIGNEYEIRIVLNLLSVTCGICMGDGYVG